MPKIAIALLLYYAIATDQGHGIGLIEKHAELEASIIEWLGTQLIVSLQWQP
jgi:hypothetical protein